MPIYHFVLNANFLRVGLAAAGLLLYLSPETILPLASFIAAVVGVVLLLWKQISVLVRRVFRFVRERVAQFRTRNPQ